MSFSVDDLKEFRRLKQRAFFVGAELTELEEEIGELNAKRERLAEQKAEFEKELSERFSELEDAGELFNFSGIDESKLGKEDYKRVSSTRKEVMFSRLVHDLVREELDEMEDNDTLDEPDDVSPLYVDVKLSDIKADLLKKYGVECRSVGNFFKDQLAKCELSGSTRARTLKVKNVPKDPYEFSNLSDTDLRSLFFRAEEA